MSGGPLDNRAMYEAIFILWRDGDSTVEARLFDWIDSYVRLMLRKRLPAEAVEDVTQTVLFHIVAGASSYRGDGLRSWIQTIARWRVADWYRERRPSIYIEIESLVVDTEPTIETAVIRAEEARQLRELISRLPDRQRAILSRRVNGQSLAEACRSVGLEYQTCKRTQSRAFSTIRKELSSD